MSKLIIDLGNSDRPNNRYITNIIENADGTKDLFYSIYSANALGSDKLAECQSIHPNFNITVEA